MLRVVRVIRFLLLSANANYGTATRGFVLPGFIDAHAHWGGYTSVYPASSWELLVFLAYVRSLVVHLI